MDMFASDVPEPIALPRDVAAWSLTERLEREFGAVGFHLSAHPLDPYADLFERLRIQPWVEFERDVREGLVRAGRLAGTISIRADRRTRKGAPMATLTLSDPSGSYEVVVFSEQIAAHGAALSVGKSVILSIEADQRPDGLGLRLLSAEPLEGAADKLGKSLEIEADSEKCLAPIKAQLKRGGNGRVIIRVAREQGRRLYEVDVGDGFMLSPALAGGIKALDGVVDVRLS